MISRKKYLLLLIIPLVFGIYYILKPIPFDKKLFKAKKLSIVYRVPILKPLGFRTKSFDYINNSPEFIKIKKILNKYTYHVCLDTLKNNNSIVNFKHVFIITFDSESLMISDLNEIIVDEKLYRIGYLGNTKITSLNNDLLKALNIGK